ncbi:MAG: glycosyltransferase family 4 protein [Cytophagaceae bacterium]
MRIAIVVNTSWNIYNFRLNLGKKFLQEGNEVFAIAPPDEYSRKLIDEGFKFVPVKMDNKGSNPFQDFLLLFRLIRIYKQIKPDVVLHYTIKPNIYGSIAARIAGISSINNVSGLGTVFLHNNLTSKIAKMLYKFAFRYPHKIFFQNKDDKDLFVHLRLIKEAKAEVIPGSGIDLVKFSFQKYSRGVPFIYLLPARVLYDKGVVEYVDAARQLKSVINAKFLIAGALDKTKLGVPEVLIREWEKDGVINYIGFSHNLREEYKKADCIVLPSYREGTSKTLLEAAACGKAIITTDVPGCREVVQDRVNGFLCKVKDANDLKDKMLKMYNLSEREISNMGENGRLKIEREFDENIVFQSYLNALKEIKSK